MLTRLKIQGFKNLLDVDLRFGPLTCIAGPNGAGKSNVFDAITFVSALADRPFVEAARMVRGGEDIRSLFSNQKNGTIDIRVELLISPDGKDDFGQSAEASSTFLNYSLTLALVSDDDGVGARIRLAHEELTYVPKGEAAKQLLFPHSKIWRDSVVKASARRTSFITTKADESRGTVIRLQSDRMQDSDKSRRGGGGSTAFAADTLPRTVLSSAQNADETRTAVLVRNEMRSWKNVQLEPSSLRAPDDFESRASLDASGKHIPATLTRLTGPQSRGTHEVYSRLANTLISLVEDVASVRVDRDEARRSLRFMMKDRSGLELPASSLSDGTMRFVALATLLMDPQERGLICLEEPENGIHPQRIVSMIGLLYDIATDTDRKVEDGNPLRQVIVSTHSNEVVREVHFADVVFAVSRKYPKKQSFQRGVVFLGISGSWRHEQSHDSISDGETIAYLRGTPIPQRERTDDRTVGWHYRSQLSLDFN
jgi:predicted ATPase